MPDIRPRLLFVPGAWVGAGEFDGLLEVLRDRGWDAAAVALPSRGSRVGVVEDAAAVTAAIDAGEGPVVLVAHSYGGVPATQAGLHPAVARIVYVAAFAPDAGESIESMLGGELPDIFVVSDGWMTVGGGGEDLRRVIAAELPPGTAPETVAEIAAEFHPQSLRSFLEPVTVAAWRERPTTYVLLTRDAFVPGPLQEAQATRLGGETVRTDYRHGLFAQDPLGVSDVLEQILLP